MCRWVAYSGPEIYLEDLIFNQEHSIVHQSLAATQSTWVTNGDGFGVAWYTQRTTPGLFKDVLPAWNDSNLRSLAAHIRTKLFFAHVRATTGTAVNRSNCHPFIWKNWTFMHNGKIGNWHDCRKDVEDLIDHIHYPYREGTTDSEALFLVALTKGLVNNPIHAIQETLRDVSKIMEKHASNESMRISCALTDGKEIWAFRYSSDDQSPSMYYGSPHTRAYGQGINPVTTIASEPSDSDATHWTQVAERQGVHWTADGVKRFNISV
ncbi:MAG: class II glutamine amidotransferase [Pseudomonadales bacterium]|jgi:glutamine amidotransferase